MSRIRKFLSFWNIPEWENARTYLDNLPAAYLPANPHPKGHVPQQRRVTDVTRVTVPGDVGSPFEFRGVRVARADVAAGEGFVLLEGA